MNGSPLRRVLHAVRGIAAQSSAIDILRVICSEARGLTRARIAVATCVAASDRWDRGIHIGVGADDVPISPLPRRAVSAAFAVHRRIATTRGPITIERGTESEAIFAGLAADGPSDVIHALPLTNRHGHLVGEIILVAESIDALDADGLAAVVELLAFVAVALENAHRFAEAKRDQDRLHFLAEAMEEVLWDWNLDSQEYWWGGGIQSLLGSQGEAVGRDVRWKDERIHPDDRDRVQTSFAACRVSQRSSWTDAYRFRRADGSWAHVEEHAFFLREAGGRAYRVIGAMRDVSALRASNEALRGNEERLRAALDASGIGTYRWDIRTNEVLHDEGAARLFDVSSSAATTMLDRMVHVHEDDRAELTCALELTAKEARELHHEYRVLGADGRVRWVLDKGRPVRGADGSAAYMPGAIIDITERKALEAEHDEARRHAIAANRAKDEFLAMLGHELRNPLAPMTSALHLLRARGEQSREIEVLDRQVAHLGRLVDDLLDVSRITQGKIELRRVNATVASVIARAVEMVSPMLERRRHEVVVSAERDLMVDADPDRLAQIISNLLNNAAKYSDAGSKIVVRASRSADIARIEVIDQGVGIESAMIGRVFDLFYQDEQTIDRSRGGLGLGLAIVKSLVELHGGRVDVRSAGAGTGSEFIIELPALPSDARAANPPKAEAPRATGNGARVLVVDDNVDGAEMLMAALETLGYAVELAHDGAQALDAAKRFDPDIALLDIGLPVMSGYELAPRLRAMKADLRLVALTGYGQEDDRRRSRDAGFDVHLVKPVDLGKLQRDLEILRAKR